MFVRIYHDRMIKDQYILLKGLQAKKVNSRTDRSAKQTNTVALN